MGSSGVQGLGYRQAKDVSFSATATVPPMRVTATKDSGLKRDGINIGSSWNRVGKIALQNT